MKDRIDKIKNIFQRVYSIYKGEGLLYIFDHAYVFMLIKYIPNIYPWTIYMYVRPKLQQYIYNHPAEPYKIIEIDPDKISEQASSIRISHVRGLSQVRAGNWDINNKLFENNWIYRALTKRFVDGYSWEKTSYPDKYNFGSDYHSKEQFINERCSYVDELFKDIQHNGYNASITSENRPAPNRKQWFQDLEPLVAIGRTGEIYHVDGTHRMSIAKILELPSIPVMVAVRHRRWQALRDEIATIDDIDQLDSKAKVHLSHPDLQDVIGKNPNLKIPT